MYRHTLAALTLLITLTACQPVRPEAELIPDATIPASEAITVTTSITGTATITGTEAVTASETSTGAPASNTPPSSTPRNVDPNTPPPSTPATGSTRAAASCPAITDPAQTLNLDIMAAWKVGDTRSYRTSQRHTDINRGIETISLASSTPFTIVVAEANETGYVLQWHYGQAILDETDVAIPDPLAALIQAPLQVTFAYETDDVGSYLGLLDVEDLRAQLVPLFDQLFDALAASDEQTPPEVLEAARGVVDRMIEDPANFEALFTGDTQLLHTLYGFTFEDAIPQVVEDMRPNLLGGSPIPSELTITPTHYDAELGCLHVLLENVADPAAARNSILEALQIQAREMGVPGPTDDDLPATLDLVDTIRIEFDLDRGWATAVYMERAVTIADQGRIESGQILLDDSTQE